MKLPRELDPVEIRVLGCLMEKEQTTPEYYPLTLKALSAACNQKSNRHPVTSLNAEDVEQAIERLCDEVLIWRSLGARAAKFKHSVDRRWELESATKAVLTVLMLRGPQTHGELRSRTERMHAFNSLEEVDEALRVLADGEEPLIVHLDRQPGESTRRWAHLLGGEVVVETQSVRAISAGEAFGGRSRMGLADRVAQLEGRVAELEQRLAEREGDQP